jgi:hypothetical protein
MKRISILGFLCLVLLITLHAVSVEADTPILSTKWSYSATDAANGQWVATGVAPASNAPMNAMSTVSAGGTHHTYAVSTDYSKSIAVAGMKQNDYLLWSVICPSGLPAGCGVDLMLTMSAEEATAPRYWITEIYDGGAWVIPPMEDLQIDSDGLPYSFYMETFDSYQHISFAQSFVLHNAIAPGDTLKLRCRVSGIRQTTGEVLPDNGGGRIYLPSKSFDFCYIVAYPGIQERDSKNIALLGNSFTYYAETPFMLKELARSQGHRLNMRMHTKGGYTFEQHNSTKRSLDVVDHGGYDYVFIQDQSQHHARYAEQQEQAPAILAATETLTARLRKHSPSAQIVLECTWPFNRDNWDGYGSAEAFAAALEKGAKAIAKIDPNINKVSPIGRGFLLAHADSLPNLYSKDKKHQGVNGAYLKTCINYLMIYGEKFTPTVSDCGCDSTEAAYMRKLAESIVLTSANK